MGVYDFTYEIPDNFKKRVVQYLQQIGNDKIVAAYMRCKYEYEKIDFYTFPIQTRTNFKMLPHPNAAARVATQILSRDGYDFPAYFIAFKIS